MALLWEKDNSQKKNLLGNANDAILGILIICFTGALIDEQLVAFAIAFGAFKLVAEYREQRMSLLTSVGTAPSFCSLPCSCYPDHFLMTSSFFGHTST